MAETALTSSLIPQALTITGGPALGCGSGGETGGARLGSCLAGFRVQRFTAPAIDDPGELAVLAAGGHTAGSWPGRSWPGTGLSEPARSPVRSGARGGLGEGTRWVPQPDRSWPWRTGPLLFRLLGRGAGLGAVRGKVPDICLEMMPQLKNSPLTRRFPVCSRPSQPPLRL